MGPRTRVWPDARWPERARRWRQPRPWWPRLEHGERPSAGDPEAAGRGGPRTVRPRGSRDPVVPAAPRHSARPDGRAIRGSAGRRVPRAGSSRRPSQVDPASRRHVACCDGSQRPLGRSTRPTAALPTGYGTGRDRADLARRAAQPARPPHEARPSVPLSPPFELARGYTAAMRFGTSPGPARSRTGAHRSGDGTWSHRPVEHRRGATPGPLGATRNVPSLRVPRAIPGRTILPGHRSRPFRPAPRRQPATQCPTP